jgi:hypothetical protein
VVHLLDNGFDVQLIDLQDQGLYDLKESHGVTPELASCHTAEVEGYIVEGHVPADLIEKMLREKPDIVGLALPDMPLGSPGMGGSQEASLEIFAFDKDGGIWLYERR